MLSHVDTVLFDLDGTLYEDVHVYDRYADELADRLPPERRDLFVAEWREAREGRGVARIGMGYDTTTDRLFEYEGATVTRHLDWNGNEVPGPESPALSDGFGQGRLNIGDWWGLPNALAAHFGLPWEAREEAFLATRAHMSGPEYVLHPEPGLVEALHVLHQRRYHIMAMSNSPVASVDDVFARLGIRALFDSIVGDARKPRGLERFLERTHHPARFLSVGDNFVNDIAPALVAGTPALYIDRHRTQLGTRAPHCFHVDSISEMPLWLLDHLQEAAR